MGNTVVARRKSLRFKLETLLTTAWFFLAPALCLGGDHPTTNPYQTRPEGDGYLPYQIIPIPRELTTDKDVKVTMPDGVSLALDVFRPTTPGKYPVVLSMTPYGKDFTPPVYARDGSPLPGAYPPYMLRVHAQGEDVGHMKISTLTTWEGPDPAFWIPHGYVVVVVDQRGGFKSGGRTPTGDQQGEDLFHLIEWAAKQEWSNGNVGMIGVSALAHNQYRAASRQPAPPHLKAIIPWESQWNRYRNATFLGGIPETNFSRSLGPFKDSVAKMPPEQAAKVWAKAMDPVASQDQLQDAPQLERITVPTLLCASWSDKGLHTPGTFEVYQRIGSSEKWLYTHGGSKWERFYGAEGLAYQKKFFDHYLKGLANGWQDTPRVRLEVRDTRDEYTVRMEDEFPLARTQYQKLYLDAQDSALKTQPVASEAKVSYNSTQGGIATFGVTFDQDTEITGYIKAKVWVAAQDADDMDLFVTVKKFAGVCDADTPTCNSLEQEVGTGRIAKGNLIHFRGVNGHSYDQAARGQMRVSQRELDDQLSTPWLPVQKFQGEKRLKPGEIVPIEIAIFPSSTLFRKGESLSLHIQGFAPVAHPLVYYDWLINKGVHTIHAGGRYDSYLQIPIIAR